MNCLTAARVMSFGISTPLQRSSKSCSARLAGVNSLLSTRLFMDEDLRFRVAPLLVEDDDEGRRVRELLLARER